MAALVKPGAGAAAGMLAAACLGCAGGHEAEQGVSSSTVSPVVARQAARTLQRAEPGSHVAQGTGNSMRPIYWDNTFFIVRPIAWEALEAGMNVAFFDPRGARVVHTLVYRDGDFWVAKGYNNDLPDNFVVTEKNLIGQVYGSFTSSTPGE